MINQYYATFIPGLQCFIAEKIKERLTDAKIIKLLDGAALFETETDYCNLNFFCFNNIFAVINLYDHSYKKKNQAEIQNRGENGIYCLEKHINSIINENGSYRENIIINNSAKFHTFRIVISNENIPASINGNLRTQAEKIIMRLSGLKIDRALPDTEFWFLFRKEDRQAGNDFSIFMKRLTLRQSWEKTLHKGELPPPLAWTLCSLAGLKHSDSLLDPFCGYGSIPAAAMKYFHITNMTACENESSAADYTAKKFKGKKGFVLKKGDFFELLKNEDGFAKSYFDAVVTDPPWGHFKNIKDEDFYVKMFDAFEKLLKNEGKAVVLCANTIDLKKAVPASFVMQINMTVLLSGRKTVIYVFNKT